MIISQPSIATVVKSLAMSGVNSLAAELHTTVLMLPVFAEPDGGSRGARLPDGQSTQNAVKPARQK